MKAITPVLLLAAACLTLASCTTTRTAERVPYDVPAYRPTDPSKVRVLVSLENQALYVMEGDKPLLVTACNVGRPGANGSSLTPTGNFTIYSKQPHRRKFTGGYLVNDSTGTMRAGGPGDRRAGERYVGYPMGYWCEFKPAYGIHAGWVHPTPRTAGCIRLHFNVAPKFYALVRQGTPLNIARTQPQDQTIGANLKRPMDYADPEFPPEILLTRKIFQVGTDRPTFAN